MSCGTKNEVMTNQDERLPRKGMKKKNVLFFHEYKNKKLA
jgi:hypothetical protein